MPPKNTKTTKKPHSRSSVADADAVAAAPRSPTAEADAVAARSRSRFRTPSLLSLTPLLEDLQVGDVTVESAFSRNGATQAGAVMSPHAPASQVAGGMRPVRGASEREEGDAMVAAGLGDSSAAAEEEEEHAVARVLNRRGHGSSREYLVQWEDQSSEWMAVTELGNCSELLKAYDRYLEEHPERNVSYAEFVSSDLPSIQLMADSPKDDCALHAVQMAFELMGGLDGDVTKLRRRSEMILGRLTLSDSGRFGRLKNSQLVKFLREEVPHTGWRVSLDAFNRNLYKRKV